MSFRKLLSFGIVGSATSAAIGALSGTLGTMCLTSYEGYDKSEATQAGAVGGAIAGGVVCTTVGILAMRGFFRPSNRENTGGCMRDLLIPAAEYTVVMVPAGLLGYGILSKADVISILSLAKTLFTFLVGSPIASLFGGCILSCLEFPVTLDSLNQYLEIIPTGNTSAARAPEESLTKSTPTSPRGPSNV